MIVLVILLLAAPLLYFWLIGHWFARVAMFLMLAALLGFIGSMLTGLDGPPEHNNGWFGMLLGFALAWPVSSIPIYVCRHKERHASLEMSFH